MPHSLQMQALLDAMNSAAGEIKRKTIRVNFQNPAKKLGIQIEKANRCFHHYNGFCQVSLVRSGSIAEVQGVQANDLIIRVAESNVTEQMSKRDVLEMVHKARYPLLLVLLRLRVEASPDAIVAGKRSRDMSKEMQTKANCTPRNKQSEHEGASDRRKRSKLSKERVDANATAAANSTAESRTKQEIAGSGMVEAAELPAVASAHHPTGVTSDDTIELSFTFPQCNIGQVGQLGFRLAQVRPCAWHVIEVKTKIISKIIKINMITLLNSLYKSFSNSIPKNIE